MLVEVGVYDYGDVFGIDGGVESQCITFYS